MKVLLTTDWYTPAVHGVVTSVLARRPPLPPPGPEVRGLPRAPFVYQTLGIEGAGC